MARFTADFDRKAQLTRLFGLRGVSLFSQLAVSVIIGRFWPSQGLNSGYYGASTVFSVEIRVEETIKGCFMPIYEYQCNACEHQLEALQKMSDDALTDCPACGKPELTKLVSAAGFRLSGGGWYETDFKTGAKKKNLAEGSKSSETSKAS